MRGQLDFRKLGTVDLRIDFLRRGLGGSFVATGSILRAGRRMAVARMQLHSDERHADCSWYGDLQHRLILLLPTGYPATTDGSILVDADSTTLSTVTASMNEKLLDSAKSPGIRLQTRRLKNEWSIEDVAADLNLRIEVIAALEADDYSKLPERTYVRGYLRAYARLLGIHEEEVLEDLPEIQRARGGLGSVLPVMGRRRITERAGCTKNRSVQAGAAELGAADIVVNSSCCVDTACLVGEWPSSIRGKWLFKRH